MSAENLEELAISSAPKIDATISVQTEPTNATAEPIDVKQDLMEPSESIAAEPVITVEAEASTTGVVPALNSINEDSSFAKSLTPTTKANLEPSATVKFVLMPMNQVVTLACPLRMTIQELKAQFASELKVDKQYLEFVHTTNESKWTNISFRM